MVPPNKEVLNIALAVGGRLSVEKLLVLLLKKGLLSELYVSMLSNGRAVVAGLYRAWLWLMTIRRGGFGRTGGAGTAAGLRGGSNHSILYYTGLSPTILYYTGAPIILYYTGLQPFYTIQGSNHTILYEASTN